MPIDTRRANPADPKALESRASVARKIVYGGIVLATLVTIAVWLLWGFRWPPTVETVGWCTPPLVTRAEAPPTPT